MGRVEIGLKLIEQLLDKKDILTYDYRKFFSYTVNFTILVCFIRSIKMYLTQKNCTKIDKMHARSS